MSTILIAEDTKFLRMGVHKLLAENNYDVVEAKDGNEAVEIYRQIKPDLVLMDFAMPDKNGMDALREIRLFDPQAKVIMLTALGQKSIALRALQSGAKDFITKPYDPEHLLTAVQKVLG